MGQQAATESHSPMLRFLFFVGALGSGLSGGYIASNLLIETKYTSIVASLQRAFASSRSELLGEIDSLRNSLDFERLKSERVARKLESSDERHALEVQELRERLARAESELAEANDLVFEKSRRLEEYYTLDKRFARAQAEAEGLRKKVSLAEAEKAKTGADLDQLRSFLKTEIKRINEKHAEETKIKDDEFEAMSAQHRDVEEKFRQMSSECSTLQRTLVERTRDGP